MLLRKRGMITTKKRKLAFLCFLLFMLLSVPFYSAFRIYKYNEYESYMFIFITLILILVVITQIISAKQNIYRYFNRIEHDLEQKKCFALFNTPDPIAILDKGNKIIWYNQSFFDYLSNKNDAFGINICEELNIQNSLLVPKSQFNIEYQNIKYNIQCVVKSNYGIELKILFFKDVTDYLNLLEEYNNKKPTVAIIAVDNYDDMFINVKESERSRIQAAMEKMLDKLTADSNSFIKRLSKDRFIVLFEEQHLNKIMKERFKILDYARSIIVNDGTCVTLSIGVGRCSSSLSESEEFARQALDMALGRGGDQAAVKTENGFEFFGGMSKGVEKHSRIKTRIISNAMQKLIENSSNVFIMGHRFGDLDSIGSSIGLSTAISITGKKSYIVVDPKNNLATHLITRVEKQHDMCTFINESKALELINPNSLLIIVDTHKSAMVESTAVYNQIKNVIVVDHHRKNINFIDNAVIFYHEPYASSTSEMITEIIQYFKNLNKLPACAADALLAGITLDTKNFVIKTGVRTFEAAAYLKKMGADTISVRSLFANTIDLYKLKSKIVSSAELYNNFAIAVADKNDLSGDDLRIIAPQASDELLSISDVIASFVIYEINDTINISARSYGTVNVQLIMEKIDGGGHQTMAATQLSGITLQEARQILIDEIEQYQDENCSEQKTI